MPLAYARRVAVAFAALLLIGIVPAARPWQARAAARDGGWQASALDLPAAWQVTRGSADVVVAIVDTGVQADHPALAGRVLPGVDLVHGSGPGADDNGHGTGLAGVVAAACPNCKLLPVKVLDAHKTGDWSTIANGVRWAADHGADVINLSLGAPHALDVLGSAVEYALGKNVIVVGAAGNDGRDEAFYPAQYPGVVSVAGIDQNDARYGWSNFGSSVTTAAPGCATTSWIGGGVVSDFCGTSTAAPFVAGIAGLARSFDPTLTPAAFAAALAATTTPLADPTTAAHGLVDANRLLLQLGAPTAPPSMSAPPRVAHVPRVGRRLVATVGVWQKAATTAVQWERSRDGASWLRLAEGPAYTPRAADVGYELRVVVTAANIRGSVVDASAATAPVARRSRRSG